MRVRCGGVWEVRLETVTACPCGRPPLAESRLAASCRLARGRRHRDPPTTGPGQQSTARFSRRCRRWMLVAGRACQADHRAKGQRCAGGRRNSPAALAVLARLSRPATALSPVAGDEIAAPVPALACRRWAKGWLAYTVPLPSCVRARVIRDPRSAEDTRHSSRHHVRARAVPSRGYVRPRRSVRRHLQRMGQGDRGCPGQRPPAPAASSSSTIRGSRASFSTGGRARRPASPTPSGTEIFSARTGTSFDLAPTPSVWRLMTAKAR